MTKPAHTYGYGIIDRHGKPDWNWFKFRKDAQNHIDRRTSFEPDQYPFRVVRLFWTGRGK